MNDVRSERKNLSEQNLIELGIFISAASAISILEQPSSLQRHAVSDDVFGDMTQTPKVRRIEIRCPERTGHQDVQLLGVWSLTEIRDGAVDRIRERRIVGVDYEYAHECGPLLGSP